MKFEILKRSHFKRKIVIGVLTVAVISAVILNFTRAKYRTTQSIPLVNGTINYLPYDFKMIGMYQQNENGEYESVDSMPSGNYKINEEKSYCTVDNINKDTSAKLYTLISGEHVIANLKKNSKCYLYFDKLKGIVYYGGYQDSAKNCNFVYSTDNKQTWQALPYSTNNINLPVGAIVKNRDYQGCAISFCSTDTCDRYVSGDPTKLGTTQNEYQITGKEATYYYYFYCFTEEMELLTYDKKKKKKLKKKVKDLKVGEYLYTYDDINKKYCYSQIKKIEITKSHEIYAIKLQNNEVIRCSEGHSLYTNEIGYMMAKELKKGYTLLGLDGKTYEIIDVKREYYKEEIELFNIYLEDKNNCFVSDLKIMTYLMTLTISMNWIGKEDIAFSTAM